MTRPSTTIARFVGSRIAIVGDVMLDHFLIGRADRISPEAPVPVVRLEREEFRLGGAANVAANIAALTGIPLLAGLIVHLFDVTLQEDIAATTRHLVQLGHDAINRSPRHGEDRQTRVAARAAAPDSQAIQLG